METTNKKDANKLLNRPITRREAIKAGGIAAVGLAFSKPLIETIYPKPAFASYVAYGNPSIRWRCPNGHVVNAFPVTCPPDLGNPEDPDPGDDLEFAGAASAGSPVTVYAYLCDAATPATQNPYLARVIFQGQKSGHENTNFIGLSINGTGVAPGDYVFVGPFDPQDCLDVRFDVSLSTPNTDTVKLQFVAHPEGDSSKKASLTISLE